MWVGNIFEANEDDIRSNFSEFGNIKEVKLIRKGGNGSFAFIQYSKESEAEAAIRGGEKIELAGRTVKVGPASQSAKGDNGKSAEPNRRDEPRRMEERSSFYDNDRNDRRGGDRNGGGRTERRSRSRSADRGRKPASTVRLQVSNLPIDMEWQELKRLGGDYGKSVMFARTWRESDSVTGMIEFGDARDADALIDALHGKKMEGSDRRLKVVYESEAEEEVIRRRRSRSPADRRRRSRSDDRRPRRR